MATPQSLSRPNRGRSGALGLTRVSDRLSFLYLDYCRVEQDDNGTHARVASVASGEPGTTYLPSASLACLMLGPGTSVTAPAAAALARNGCAVVFVGAGAVRMYSTWSPLSSSTALLERQARAFADPVSRLSIAQQMLIRRFPDQVLPAEVVSLEQLRGFEGLRMKALYQFEARRRRLSGWRRRFDGSDGKGQLDPVNEALNAANTALYGICLAAICALGMSPGLGFIHSGSPRSFVLDVADLYKAELTIPLAFKLHQSSDPHRDVMRELREEFRLLRILPSVVNDLYEIFQMEPGPDEWDIDSLSLWNTDGTFAAAGWNRYERDPGIS